MLQPYEGNRRPLLEFLNLASPLLVLEVQGSGVRSQGLGVSAPLISSGFSTDFIVNTHACMHARAGCAYACMCVVWLMCICMCTCYRQPMYVLCYSQSVLLSASYVPRYSPMPQPTDPPCYTP